MATALRTQKRAMRKTVSATLQALSPSAIEEQSRAVTTRVLTLPAFQQSKSVSCYLSMPSGELDTSVLVAEILGNGKSLFVPKIDPTKDGHMDFVKVYGSDDLRTFPSGLWGIKEPGPLWQGLPRQTSSHVQAGCLDVILVPGVAFDHSLSRLGHGKGYYDRFITSYSSSGRPRPLLVALALREQVMEGTTVPVEDHDWSMDVIVTPDKIFSKDGIEN